jgi:SAM-dependent methyltransferase
MLTGNARLLQGEIDMILPALIKHHLRHGDDAEFYRMQARDAIAWLKANGVVMGPQTHALDLGAGHGIFGEELLRESCRVTFADEQNLLFPHLRDREFRLFNIDRESLEAVGRYDLVICSNVLEHLSKPERLLSTIQDCLTPKGYFYLSWTNWLSPWGGHEFSPFHFAGARLGPNLWERVTGKKRIHTPGVNLFPTSIGETLARLRHNQSVQIVRVAPRYYTEFAWLSHLPIVREFLSWNCAMLIRRAEPAR